MKAMVVREFGGPEVLQYSEVPLPTLRANEILVKNAAIGVNFVDTQHRAGTPYPIGLPLIPGVEGAGIVEAVGSDVVSFHVGDRVGHAGFMGGVYAEYSYVPEDRLIPIPDDVDFATAAAVLMQGMTAHALTQSAYRVRAGDIVLVHGAAGGVGLYLVEMAKQAGATVIGTVSSEDKARLTREFGCDHVILSKREDFVAETQRLTGGQGVQVIYLSGLMGTANRGSLFVTRARTWPGGRGKCWPGQQTVESIPTSLKRCRWPGPRGRINC